MNLINVNKGCYEDRDSKQFQLMYIIIFGGTNN